MESAAIKPKQFEELMVLLREGYEAGALRHIDIVYSGAAKDAFPGLDAKLSFSSRPSNRALDWLRGTIDRFLGVLRGR